MDQVDTGNELFIRTIDYTQFNPLEITISGRQVLDNRSRQSEYIYFTERETNCKIRFQTQAIHHWGPFKQYGQLVFPISRHAEPHLYRRILLLEAKAEEHVVNYLRLTRPDNFFTEAAQSAWEARCRIDNLQRSDQSQKHTDEMSNLQLQTKVFRSTYSKNNDTLWLRLSDQCKVFGPEGEPIEGNLETILGRGRYEFIIRASVVFLDKRSTYGAQDYTFASLILRICQIRYKAQSESDKSICRFQPEIDVPQFNCQPDWSDFDPSAPDSDPSDQSDITHNSDCNPSDFRPWMSTNLRDWVGIINGTEDCPLLPRAMSPKTPPKDPEPTCAPLCDLSDSEDTIMDPWPASQTPQETSINNKPNTKKAAVNRKRKSGIGL